MQCISELGYCLLVIARPSEIHLHKVCILQQPIPALPIHASYPKPQRPAVRYRRASRRSCALDSRERVHMELVTHNSLHVPMRRVMLCSAIRWKCFVCNLQRNCHANNNASWAPRAHSWEHTYSSRISCTESRHETIENQKQATMSSHRTGEQAPENANHFLALHFLCVCIPSIFR